MKAFKVTYRVYDGWKYNEPNSFHEKTEIIVAEDKDDAYWLAEKRANTPSLIAHDSVTVSKKDVKHIKGNLGAITVLMFNRFHTVDIGVPALGESTLVALEDGKDFRVEFVQQFGGYIYLKGFKDGENEYSQISAEKVDDKELSEVLHSLQCLVGELAGEYSRQYLMLHELVTENSPFGKNIPAVELGFERGCENVQATLLDSKEGRAVLLHWPFEGDYTRALVIPEDEFDIKDRVIEAIKSFCEA